jgi:hypothetical protein
MLLILFVAGVLALLLPDYLPVFTFKLPVKTTGIRQPIAA